MRETLEKKVEDTVRRHGMLKPGDHVIVAVSGGVDSVVLLHVLYSLREKWRLTLKVAHLDHGLRGHEAKEDADFVKEYATSLGLICIVERADVVAHCQRNDCSTEQGARELRYDFLRRIFLDYQADSVATGHTANDQAETVLMRLLRGSGSSGLSAVRPIRDDWVIRPMLDVTAAEINKYSVEHRLSFRSDRTNVDQDITRNRIRHHLLPLLQKEYNPHIVGSLVRLANVIRVEAEYLDEQAQLFLEKHTLHSNNCLLHLKVDTWPSTATAIQRILVRHFVGAVGGKKECLNYHQIEDIRAWIEQAKTGQIRELAGRIRFEKRRTGLVVYGGGIESYWLDFQPPGCVHVPGTEFSINVLESTLNDAPKATPNRAIFDAELVSCLWTIRSRKPGDVMSPYGLRGHKSLKKLFNEWDVPRLLRNRVPIVTAGKQVLWVAGFRQSTVGLVNEKTRRVLIAELAPNNSSG